MSRVHHILVIDDDAAMRSLVVDYLKSIGHKVTESGLACEALKRIQDGEFSLKRKKDGSLDLCRQLDLVISDWNMPGMTGIQLVALITEMATNVPIILMTAYDSNEIALRAKSTGAFDCATKPFKLAELREKVDRALALRDLDWEREN